MTLSQIVHFRAGGVSLVLDCPAAGLPAVVHWGAALGETSPEDLAALAREMAPLPDNTTDDPVRLSVVPEHAAGWMGAPGLQGHRSGGRSWSASFGAAEYDVVHGDGTPGGELSAGGCLAARASDPEAGLALEVELRLSPDRKSAHCGSLSRTQPSRRSRRASSPPWNSPAGRCGSRCGPTHCCAISASLPTALPPTWMFRLRCCTLMT